MCVLLNFVVKWKFKLLICSKYLTYLLDLSFFKSNNKFGNRSLALRFWLAHKGREGGNKSVNRMLY